MAGRTIALALGAGATVVYLLLAEASRGSEVHA